jgi:hypothetical protein
LSVAKLSVVSVFAARLLLEERFALADSEAAALPVFVLVLAVLLVALPATAGPFAVVVLLVVPTVPEVLPPLEEVLFDVVLPADEPVPPFFAAAKLPVKSVADVLLLAVDLFAVTPSVPEAVLLLLAVRDPVFEKALVVPLALLEFSAASFVTDAVLLAFSAAAFVVALDLLEFAENAFVVPLELLEFFEAASDSVAVRLLLAPACCMLLLLVANVFELVKLFESSLVYDLLAVVAVFSEELMLDEDVFDLVTFELLFTVSWLFVPRL